MIWRNKENGNTEKSGWTVRGAKTVQTLFYEWNDREFRAQTTLCRLP